MMYFLIPQLITINHNHKNTTQTNKGVLPTMKVKLRNIIESSQSFSILLDQNPQIIKAQIRWDLSEDFEKITKSVDLFNKKRVEIIQRYNITSSTLLASPEYQSCELEITDLLDVEIELVTEPFLTKSIMTDERCTLTSKDMISLKWLRVDESKKEEDNNDK